MRSAISISTKITCGRWTMSVLNVTKAALLGTVLYIPLAIATAGAADLILYPEPAAEQSVDFVLPAVSGPNGKFELDIGALSDPSSAIFRAGASFTFPVGDAFGLQGDLAVGSFADEWVGGGALHAFTRDPSSYLVGVTAGVVVADGAMLSAIGAEGELYLDRISLEGWAGWAALEYDDVLLTDESGFFGIGDIAYYPTDDWRLSIGVASILGSNSLKLATEYQFADLGMPFSGTGEIRAYDTGAWSAKIGIKGYFGGDSDKSLIDRHRQDDPPNRVLDLFAAANLLTAEADAPPDACSLDPEACTDPEACVDADWAWDSEGSYCYDPEQQ